MKRLLPPFWIIFIFPLFMACHKNKIKNQTVVYEGNTYLDFKLAFATDSTSVDDIDWKKEHLVSKFTLKGKIPLQYSVSLVNDTLATLAKYDDQKWNFQENLNITDWAVRRVNDMQIISEFNITDFDKDGDEDLIVWTATNVNTNRWTLIFLNSQEHQKLVRLYDTADGSDIWDAPDYDKKTGRINCELYSGAYGLQYTSSYKLNGTTAQPLIKSESDLRGEHGIRTEYVGENGKWKLISKEIDE